MSLMINIYYKGKNGNAKKFVQEMIDSGFVEEIRKEFSNEVDNLRYSLLTGKELEIINT